MKLHNSVPLEFERLKEIRFGSTFVRDQNYTLTGEALPRETFEN